MFFSPLTIVFNGFPMVLGSLNYHHLMIPSPRTIGFNGFSMVLGSFNHWFQWFSMVMDHWSNDAMVSMYCSPLTNMFTTTTISKEVGGYLTVRFWPDARALSHRSLWTMNHEWIRYVGIELLSQLKKWRFGLMSAAGQTDDWTRKDRAAQPMDHGRQIKTDVVQYVASY